ncbi:6986_t:CDS:1, partial [Paraglomus occultum]
DIGNIVGEEEIYEIDDEEMAEVNRPKGSNFHQRGHYFIFYEDGTTEH